MGYHAVPLQSFGFFLVTSRKIVVATASNLDYYPRSFPDCSGGNSRPSRPSGAGGGTFFLGSISQIEMGALSTGALLTRRDEGA
jgi:hypothetical protein